jgi:hypothetical protein
VTKTALYTVGANGQPVPCCPCGRLPSGPFSPATTPSPSPRSSTGLLLARHLFATTSVDRVQAITDVANVPGRHGLAKAGFHREGVLRGVSVLRGQRRDGVLYSLLRTDLNW